MVLQQLLTWCNPDFCILNRCQMFPIIGNRYKCAIRQDFDLCESCQETDNSPFPYLKVCLKNVEYIYSDCGIVITFLFRADQVS